MEMVVAKGYPEYKVTQHKDRRRRRFRGLRAGSVSIVPSTNIDTSKGNPEYEDTQARGKDGKWIDGGEGTPTKNKRINQIREPSQEAQLAASFYAGVTFRSVNAYLRGKQQSDNLGPIYDVTDVPPVGRTKFPTIGALVEKLDEFIASYKTNKRMVVYRGISPRVLHQFAGLNRGDVVVDRAFVSTSMDEDTAIMFSASDLIDAGGVMKIEVPAGTHVGPIVLDDPSEGEIVLPRGSRFEFKGKVGSERISGRETPVYAFALVPTEAERKMEKAEETLYAKLGGNFGIAALVDYFSDGLINDPEVGRDSSNPQLRDWHRNSLDRLPGLKFMRTLWVIDVTGGPLKYQGTRPGDTRLGLEEAHRRLKISPVEFDAVAAVLERSLDRFDVPKDAKDQVLAAFADHKGEVTAGYTETDKVNPNVRSQPRDQGGRWTAGGGGSSGGSKKPSPARSKQLLRSMSSAVKQIRKNPELIPDVAKDIEKAASEIYEYVKGQSPEQQKEQRGWLSSDLPEVFAGVGLGAVMIYDIVRGAVGAIGTGALPTPVTPYVVGAFALVGAALLLHDAYEYVRDNWVSDSKESAYAV